MTASVGQLDRAVGGTASGVNRTWGNPGRSWMGIAQRASSAASAWPEPSLICCSTFQWPTSPVPPE